MNALSSFFSVTQYALKICLIGSSGHQIYTTINNEKLSGIQKTQNVALNTLYIFTSGAASLPTGTLPLGMIETCRTLTPFTLVGKFASDSSIDTQSKVTRNDLAQGFCWELLEVGSNRIMRPIFGELHPYIPFSADVVTTIALLLLNDKVRAIPERIKSLWKEETPQMNRLVNNQVPFQVRMLDSGEMVYMFPPKEYKERKQLKEYKSIEEMKKIPSIFYSDVFDHYRCSLSKKRIRHIVVVKGTEGTAAPVFYEKAEIKKWMRQNPETKPESWPRRVKYRRFSIIEAKDHQAVIDRQLQKYLEKLNDDFKNQRIEEISEEVE